VSAGISARFPVHVVPRSRVTEIAGRYGDAIRIRLAAPPVDGAANDALVRFLAERLGVARGDIRIATGAAGRRKIVEVDGMPRDVALKTLLGANA
jgi:uncharacterized protein (TIGR00251 family)